MSSISELANQGRVERNANNFRELVMKTESGAKMMSTSMAMYESGEMNKLMDVMCNTGADKEEWMALSKHMGALLNHSLDNGMLMFVKYLESTAKTPGFESRADYYMNVAKAAQNVNDAKSYVEYIAAYRQFSEDNSPENLLAKQAMEVMQADMAKMAEDTLGQVQ